MDALKVDAEGMNGVGGIKLVTTTVKMRRARCTCCEAGRGTRACGEMEEERDRRGQGK